MKTFLFFLVLVIASFPANSQDKNISYNPNEKKDTTKKSIRSAAVGKIAAANVRINYYSPGVRGRIIWGGVVPLNEVWVTGAHAATNIEIDKAFVIGNTTVPAGTYAIFTIPSENEWTFILNKNYQQHLTDEYDQKEDVLRINVKPIISTHITERLQYFIESDRIAVAWEKVRIEIPVKIK